MKRARSPFALAAVLVVVALIGLLAYGIGSTKPDRGIDRALAQGKRREAPKLDLPQLDGSGRKQLAAYRGKVVVLNFWASWCDPCRDESPLLQRWHERISKNGKAMVLGVDVLDVADDARAFARQFGLTYPMVRDRTSRSLTDYGVVGYPETFVIDRRGKIAASRRGPIDEAFMRRHVEPLIEEKE